MKIPNTAMRLIRKLTPRSASVLLLAAIFALIPQAAFADGSGENVKLHLTSNDSNYIYISLGLGLVAWLFGWIFSQQVMRESPGSEKMQSVGKAIRDGALAYLRQQIRTMLFFVAALFVILVWMNWNEGSSIAIAVGISFMGGVAASYFAGFMGMIMAVNGNMRTANAAMTSNKRALEVAFKSGAVAGMMTVGAGLIGASLILLLAKDNAMTLLIGFGFGGSLAALFTRVGGGIFTKAADVGADLVGKVEAGIPEDDPRNPATIADNVGDNVGDCAGMAADIFESYEVTLVAAIVLGAASAAIFDQATWMKLILFALMARGVGIVASIFGIYMVKGDDDVNTDALASIRRGFYSSAAVAGVATFALAYFMMGGSGGKATIVTTQVSSAQEVVLKSAAQIKTVQAQIAKQKAEPDYKVTAEEVMGDASVKALGYDASNPSDQQFITGVLQADLSLITPPKPLSGYHKVTNFSEATVPQLGYAVPTQNQSILSDSSAPSPGQYQTVASLFGSSGTDKLVVAQLHSKQVFPGTPGAPGRPATPPNTRESTSWTPLMHESFLNKIVADSKKNAKNGSSLDLVKEEPVSLYISDRGDLAVGMASDVRVDSVRAVPYYAMSVADITKLAAPSPTGAPPALPPTKSIAPVVESSNVVEWWKFALMITFGIVMAFAIEMLTDYYVSTHKRPTQEVAGVATAGPAPMIIQGFAYACESSVFMVFSIVIALLFPLFFFTPAMYGGYILSFYGIALVGLGLLTTTGFVLAMDTFGPISDNAQGVYEMSGEGHDNEYGSKSVQRLDAAGNTTKALTKGFAITTAVVAAVALFHSYLDSAHLNGIGLPLDVPEIFLGLLIGGAAPFLFSAFSINAVGRAAFHLINEVRRQFREDPGIMAGTSLPNYARCVAIVTAAAQKELLGPGILAISLPVAVGFGFSIGKPLVTIDGQQYHLTGAQALGGFLAGSILTGQLLAVVLANSGGMWDNAKKIIEDGLYGGKGTEAHKAGVVCDTVGDPFKDTAGPALNPLIKVMNLVALLLATKFILPLSDQVLALITFVALAALAFAIYTSKKGSMSQSIQEAQASPSVITGGGTVAMNLPPAAPVEAPVKRKITMEDEPVTPPEE